MTSHQDRGGSRGNGTVARAAVVAAGVVGVAWFATSHREAAIRFVGESEARARRYLRRAQRRSESRKHYEQGRWQGFLYRTGNRFPDPEVDEDQLADRVRSVLGTLEKRYDIPRVHVTAERHRIILHGDVDAEPTAEAIVSATQKISGVGEVVSHLGVGFTRGETRPSQGTAVTAPSHALKELTDAVTRSGLTTSEAPAAIGAVLLTFLRRLPVPTRRHLASHLPNDVLALLPPHGWKEAPLIEINRVDQFVSEVSAFGSLVPSETEPVVESVLARLRSLVPEEVEPVAATLPSNLRHLWTAVA